jgi:hypothetical protein
VSTNALQSVSVFHWVQDEGLEKLNRAFEGGASDSAAGGRVSDECDQRMFAQIAHVVEEKRKIIPSLVWLERPQKRLDLRRAILGDALNSVVDFSSIPSEGKKAEFQVGVSGVKVGADPGRMIEA